MWRVLFIGSFFAAAQLSAATDHIVGGHLGWNPNINYSSWENNQTFFVNDFISFRYHKYMYNVFEVNQTGYDNCTTDSAVGNWTSGKDFVLLTEAKRYYFICPGFCFSGMKVSVLVHPLSSPPPSTNHHMPESLHGNGGGVVLRGSFVGFLAASIALFVAWIGL
ncbi:early nodulin-like protein 19 [Wolffia australiana]